MVVFERQTSELYTCTGLQNCSALDINVCFRFSEPKAPGELVGW